ncbi:barstar family protein [Actinoplanes sp. NPDC048796]|uniref:barstar family protein n=1 Tax=unclassified Actinoplanes TaxID=2626549 RepID=UPI0033E44825
MNELVIDLRGRVFATARDFWAALAGPAGLPDWAGRNLDAWQDTVESGGISEVVDGHDRVVVHVDRAGWFADERNAGPFARDFGGERSRLTVHSIEDDR